MQQIFDALFGRPVATLGLGAFLSGVSLLYLMIQRTRKHRIKEAEEREL